MPKTRRLSKALVWGFAMSLLTKFPVMAQQSWFEQGYAHNDYLHKKPLFEALENGYTHIEVDIFLLNDSLIVAHWFPYFKDKRTLESLYLAPLKQYLESNKWNALSSVPPVTLVIDIKSSPQKTYLALRSLLEKYKSMLSGYENGVFRQGSVNIVITGRKPVGLISNETSRLVMLDDLLDHTSVLDNTNLFAMASCKYSNVLKWTGKGRMPPEQEKRLLELVILAHHQGKKVRLWASPENEFVWRELLNCGIDYINTDQLVRLKNFCRFHSSPLQAQIPAVR